jgi:UDP-N-acetylglucosamine 2-epimerase (non-hydrolysing)/GDP/UDP-N,N'-diacetylbacillosamine 2-epimerase (hydrolysing)
MSHLHFVTNEEAFRRVRQLGENPDHIYNTGSPGLDCINNMRYLSRAEMELRLDFSFYPTNLLITFHPVTLDTMSSAEQFQSLLDALHLLGGGIGCLFSKPNADPEGRVIGQMIDDYVGKHESAHAYTSLGQELYLNLMAQVDAVVGNSSSGLYEAPSFKKPTVNIGDRQKGRLQASSVVNAPPDRDAILRAIRVALQKDCSETINPYGAGGSSVRILKILKDIEDPKALLKKPFFLMEGRDG